MNCGANSMLSRWPDREVITMSACWPWLINQSIPFHQKISHAWEIYLNYVPKLVDLVVGAEPLPEEINQIGSGKFLMDLETSGWPPHCSWCWQCSWLRHSSRPHLGPFQMHELSYFQVFDIQIQMYLEGRHDGAANRLTPRPKQFPMLSGKFKDWMCRLHSVANKLKKM